MNLISDTGPTSCRTTSETSTWPPFAFPATRAAMLTAAPKKSPASSTTSPVLMPIRMRRRRWGFAFVYSEIARWMSSAHSTAWRVEPKLTMTPSPRPLIRRPACSAIFSPTMVSYAFMISCDSVKPRVDRRFVEPSTSVNMIATVPSVCPVARLPMIVSTVSGALMSMFCPSPCATSRSSDAPALKPASPCGYLTISSSPASTACRSSRPADSFDRWFGAA